jgi:hypothetical protein
MKHGVLLLAHRDIEQIKALLTYFDEDFAVYIHLDKKSGFTEEQITDLRNTPNVQMVSNRYSINWGGHHLLKATLLLASEAIRNKKLGYIHLISGQDFAIKPLSEFKAFFEENNGREFIEYFSVPTDRWAEGGLDRIQYYAPYDLIDARGRNKRILLGLISMQKRLGLKRSYPRNFPQIYGGSAWWSITRPCLEYIVRYSTSYPEYYRRFKYTFACDEMYFQTALMSSPFAEKAVNNNLRYIAWSSSHASGDSPIVLTMEDFDRIISSGHLFARKFVLPGSRELIRRIRDYVHKNN